MHLKSTTEESVVSPVSSRHVYRSHGPCSGEVSGPGRIPGWTHGILSLRTYARVLLPGPWHRLCWTLVSAGEGWGVAHTQRGSDTDSQRQRRLHTERQTRGGTHGQSGQTETHREGQTETQRQKERGVRGPGEGGRETSLGTSSGCRTCTGWSRSSWASWRRSSRSRTR